MYAAQLCNENTPSVSLTGCRKLQGDEVSSMWAVPCVVLNFWSEASTEHAVKNKGWRCIFSLKPQLNTQ